MSSVRCTHSGSARLPVSGWRVATAVSRRVPGGGDQVPVLEGAWRRWCRHTPCHRMTRAPPHRGKRRQVAAGRRQRQERLSWHPTSQFHASPSCTSRLPSWIGQPPTTPRFVACGDQPKAWPPDRATLRPTRMIVAIGRDTCGAAQRFPLCLPRVGFAPDRDPARGYCTWRRTPPKRRYPGRLV